MKTILPESLLTSDYKAVGFDLDNTLYNEKDFITQAYNLIAIEVHEVVGVDPNDFKDFLLDLWIRLGSKSPQLFQKAFDHFHIKQELRDDLLGRMIAVFRSFVPHLKLDPQIENGLTQLQTQNKKLFLVTDGHAHLQMNKIKSLGLNQWFDEKNIWISEFGLEKPDAKIATKIPVLNNLHPKDVVFLGDHAVDESFAHHCGFDFIKVNFNEEYDD